MYSEHLRNIPISSNLIEKKWTVPIPIYACIPFQSKLDLIFWVLLLYYVRNILLWKIRLKRWGLVFLFLLCWEIRVLMHLTNCHMLFECNLGMSKQAWVKHVQFSPLGSAILCTTLARNNCTPTNRCKWTSFT